MLRLRIRADSGLGVAHGIIRDPHHPIGIWNGTEIVYVPIRTWTGTTLV